MVRKITGWQAFILLLLVLLGGGGCYFFDRYLDYQERVQTELDDFKKEFKNVYDVFHTYHLKMSDIDTLLKNHNVIKLEEK